MHYLGNVLELLTHEPGGIGGISAHFSIDFNEALVDDCNDLASGQSILEPVTEKNCEGKGFTELVRTRGWAGSLWSVFELARTMKGGGFLT